MEHVPGKSLDEIALLDVIRCRDNITYDITRWKKCRGEPGTRLGKVLVTLL